MAVGADIVDRLATVRARIESAGGDPSRITIVAVTKGFGIEAVRLAAAAGLGDLGENYLDEMAAKMPPARALRLGVRWHYLGAIQRNKVRRVAGGVHLWQSVDRLAAGEEIAKRAPGAQVLVQVNVSGDPSRNGTTWEGVPALVRGLDDLGLHVRGVMGVAPLGEPEDARPGFRRLTALAGELGLPEVSMGMSHDLEIAVEEGTTMVRVGTALFGPRPQRMSTRR